MYLLISSHSGRSAHLPHYSSTSTRNYKQLLENARLKEMQVLEATYSS